MMKNASANALRRRYRGCRVSLVMSRTQRGETGSMHGRRGSGMRHSSSPPFACPGAPMPTSTCSGAPATNTIRLNEQRPLSTRMLQRFSRRTASFKRLLAETLMKPLQVNDELQAFYKAHVAGQRVQRLPAYARASVCWQAAYGTR